MIQIEKKHWAENGWGNKWHLQKIVIYANHNITQNWYITELPKFIWKWWYKTPASRVWVFELPYMLQYRNWNWSHRMWLVVHNNYCSKSTCYGIQASKLQQWGISICGRQRWSGYFTNETWSIVLLLWVSTDISATNLQ